MPATDRGLWLSDHGIEVVPGLSRQQAAEILAFLGDKPQYDGHIVDSDRPSHAHTQSTQTCWSMADVLQAPHVVETALQLTAAAGAYLEADPLLYSVNAFTMYPSAQPTSRDTQEFHRDRDDVRFLALFIYLTDVLTPEDGAHQFQVGTHRGAVSGTIAEVVGPAGRAFLSDGRGLHRGLRPTTAPRTILWIRWGVSNPPASYVWCGLRPVDKALVGDRYPTDPALQRSVRLVLA